MNEVIGKNLISRLKPKNKQYDVRDSKLKGFLIRVTPTGKMQYVCQYQRGKRINIGQVGVLTPTQARDRATKILADAVKGVTPENKKHKKTSPTLNEFIKNEYSEWRHANRKSAHKDIERLMVNFSKDFGHLVLSAITPVMIDKWRSKRIGANIKHVTVNRDISNLKALLKKAEEWEYIAQSPLQKFKLARIDSLSKIRYLADEEEIKLKKALIQRDENLKLARISGNKWRKGRSRPTLPDLCKNTYADHITPMVLISLNTGLRRGELFTLRWSNVNFNQAMLTISADVAKSGKARYIPLNSTTLQVFKNWKLQSSSNELVFSNNKSGLVFNNVKKAWAGLLKLAEIENFRWHDMRHHFASKLVMAGVDLNTVRELLGHADIKMTLRYAHLAPEHKANAVEKLVIAAKQAY